MKKLFILLFLLSVFLPIVFAGSQDDELYSDAVAAVKDKNFELAFSDLHTLVSTCTDEKLLDKSMFSLGEYYFSTGNYKDAVRIFMQINRRFLNSKARLFVLAYLLEISRMSGDKEEAVLLEREIISFTKVSLLFRDYKVYRYVSVFKKTYKSVYFIDKIEFYIDDKLFSSIAY